MTIVCVTYVNIFLIRFGTVPRALPFEPHFSVDINSSESGFTSQDSTMERCKTEPLWHVPSSSSRGQPGAGQRRLRQDAAVKDSPNRHSKGEIQYSSHSSSNTLSSNASSNHSDERWFDGAGERVDPSETDPDLNKGGSNDSGIDASTHYNNSLHGSMPNNHPHKAMHSSATYNAIQELSVGRGSGTGESKSRESSPKGYHEKLCFPFRAYTPQGYKTPAAEKTRPVRAATTTPTSAQHSSTLLSTSAPKSSYGKSRPVTWQVEDSTSEKKQVDTNSKNVFGQPRLRASLRDLRSPRRTYKSTIEDDLKKLIIMDNPGEAPERETSPRCTLQRTFSDESLCSGRRDASFANSENQSTPTDVLFTCTLPTRRQASSNNHSSQLQNKKGMFTSGLVCLFFVTAQRAVSLFSLNEPLVGPDLRPASSPVPFQTPQTPRTTPTLSGEETPNDLSGRLFHLEVMLKQLNNDLEREKKDKVVLLAEMANLRENNQRLQEESHTASEQLRKFTKKKKRLYKPHIP
uniref:Signal-induced proliferation-associated 1-like protein C-terminal domain-containing protein n=1 Tax=Periophthalmus magnuspinnatus TaxID=409849 RepID=A0A3B4AL05_9GOBI